MSQASISRAASSEVIDNEPEPHISALRFGMTGRVEIRDGVRLPPVAKVEGARRGVRYVLYADIVACIEVSV